ncbi:hypothetical protein ACFQX4_20735 [Roseomonas sp. GCM10028921]
MLREIARLAGEAADGHAHHRHRDDNDDHSPGAADEVAARSAQLGCTPKQLPLRLVEQAARTAVRINPVNQPLLGAMAAFGLNGDVMTPQRIAVLTSKYWGPKPRQLTVSFMDGGSQALRDKIIHHLNAWSRRGGGISFTETRGIGDVRISRGGGGYWSYLGTDILMIPRDQQTMNLEGFTLNTPDSEYARVIRHEAGHTLGFPHEHMRRELVAQIDRQRAYDFFLRTQGWDRRTVDQQVLTALDQRSIMGTPPDQDSSMCYQLPAEITKNRQPIRGGMDINASDAAFCARIYPKAGSTPSAAPSGHDERGLEETAVEPALTVTNFGDWDPKNDPLPDERHFV